MAISGMKRSKEERVDKIDRPKNARALPVNFDSFIMKFFEKYIFIQYFTQFSVDS
jgi:hypothetical protein